MFREELRAWVAGESEPGRAEGLRAHARECAECRRTLGLHADLVRLAAQAPEPAAEEYDALRSRVLEQVARGAWRRAPGSWFRAAAAIAAGLLLFLAGVLLGRGPLGTAAPSRLAAAVRENAAANRSLQDVANSPYTYSGVSFRRLEDDRVALGFDVTTHLEVVEPERSPLVRELVVHALVHPSESETGARMKAVAHAAGARDPKVRDALLLALRRDENLAVRTLALAALVEHLDEPEVEAAMFETLREDVSVQVRMLALDTLAASIADRGRLRRAIATGDRPGAEALQVRLAHHERGR